MAFLEKKSEWYNDDLISRIEYKIKKSELGDKNLKNNFKIEFIF